MKKRKSGVLLHITSLASPFGIGDLGPDAHSTAEFLYRAGQSLWQTLPLNPTSTKYGNSPYSSISAFAGNPVMISPRVLCREGLLSEQDIKPVPDFNEHRVDYPAVEDYKQCLLEKAFCRFSSHLKNPGTKQAYHFQEFCVQNQWWLENFSMFGALKAHFNHRPWNQWTDSIKNRNSRALREAKKELGEAVRKQKFLQYIFYTQWQDLKSACTRLGIQLIGDIPLYVNYDSADVWAHPHIFKLDTNKAPSAVAGVPPDYFSSTGQLWNNPVYNWEASKKQNYRWWIQRIAHNLRLFHLVRLDHFRGLSRYWEVPAGQTTAQNGTWADGPKDDFFHALLGHFPCLPLIAEDLGEITADVRELRDRFGLPGMRVLQFAFSCDEGADYHKPHNYTPNCVAYTGTHDNDTLMGWYRKGAAGKGPGKPAHTTRKTGHEKTIANALNYMGSRVPRNRLHWELIRLVMMSCAGWVIFPLQDILGLGEEARMNRPGIPEGNWEWRVSASHLTSETARTFKHLTETYGRKKGDRLLFP
ncbi:MAG: 4-alpha-glucanotransferase [Spirochaetota bacterium]